MASQRININKFNKGTITAPDSKDIDLESASESLNVDGDIAPGKIVGIPTNGSAYSANGTALPDIRIADFIENNGQYDLIYHDSSDNHISAVTDFYDVQANRTLSDLVTSNVSDNAVIVANNRNVHVGTGIASTNLTKWIGYVDTAWFGGFTEEDQFDGSGLDDATGDLSGLTDTTQNVYWNIEITNTGTPDVFRWNKNGGSFTTGVNITGAAQTLSDGVTITFAATTGHTLGDKWYITKFQKATTLQTTEDRVGVTNFYSVAATETTGSGDKYFKTTKIYQWAVSLVYDGYQEGVLYPSTPDTPGTDSEYYTIVVTCSNALDSVQNINPRTTGVNIYRRESEDLSTNSYGLWRKVYSITSDQSWAASADDLTFTILDYGLSAKYSTDDPIPLGATYEENSGMPETLEDTTINYSLACKGNGFLFVGKCYHPDISEASQCIFRSKSKRFSMFDWSTDILRLPRVPTAMAFYLGRLYAFDLNNIYVINPDLMVIEDILPGAGAKGQRSVTVTPYGMFFANDNNAYMFDGRELVNIGNRIKNNPISTGTSWRSLSGTIFSDYIVLYEGQKGCVLFIGSKFDDALGNLTRVWAYHIQNDRWDYWGIGDIVVDANSGAFSGKDGEIFLSNATQLVELFAGASRQNFEWTSQDITLDDPSLDKMWYDLIIDSNGAGSVTGVFGTEGTTPATALTSTTKIQSGGDYVYAKSLKFKLTSSGVEDVNAVTIIARPLVGSRVY